MNLLVKKFGDKKIWVSWRLVERDGKKTKIPYTTAGLPAKSTDPKDWSCYEDVIKKYDQVGIVFSPEKKLLGVDIDKIIRDGSIISADKDIILKFISEANTYCEFSPSMTGLHLFFELEEPITLKANRKGCYECYVEGRYFTFTGNSFGLEQDVRTVSVTEMERLLTILGYPWKTEEEKSPIKNHTVTNLSNTELLEKMFNSKNGEDIKALYGGDITRYGDDESSADMALCSHFAFWTGCNASQIEELWVGSPLGQRKKTASRRDYRERTINKAINNCREVYTNPNTKKMETVKELELLFKLGPKGAVMIVVCLENVVRILNHNEEFKGKIRYDEFTNVVYYKDREMKDGDILKIQARIQVLYPDFMKVSKDMVYDAMMKVSVDNSFDSAIDYIKSIKWDGVKRVDSWLSNTYGTPDDEYHISVGSNWLKGLVKRIVIPGCKFDNVLVLEGKQGTKKSTSLMTLGGSWHVETTMSTDSKDFFMLFQGKAIIEFSEGETLSRTETKRMKAIITTQSDKYRPAYGRLSVDFPRRCVFAMTTNAEEYLKDETGNRRWLPVKCVGIANIEWLEKNRDQLFAEAYQRVIVNKESTWEFPEELMQKAQDERVIHDSWEEPIAEWFMGLSEAKKNVGISIRDVYEQAIYKNSITIKPITKYEEMNIGNVLRNFLKLEKRRSTFDGLRTYRYYPEGAPVITMHTKDLEVEADKDILAIYDL